MGLGGEFYDAVEPAVGIVREHHELGVAVHEPHAHRQYLVDGFPYKFIYGERTDDLVIVRRSTREQAPRVLEATTVVDSG